MEVLNKNFQEVFTKEDNFVDCNGNGTDKKMDYIKIDKKELKRLVENLDGRKSMGPDEVLGQVLKECNKELLEPIYNIIV